MRLTIREYLSPDGRSPFRDWLSDLDVPTRARVQARVLRFETGNLGDHKAVGDVVWEARLDFGPGYRLYLEGPAKPSCCCSAATRDRRRETSSEPSGPGRTT